jgi:hypothetical protein
MVGDNPVADVRGAENVGIPAVLVRREPKPVDTRRYSKGLTGTIAIIR